MPKDERTESPIVTLSLQLDGSGLVFHNQQTPEVSLYFSLVPQQHDSPHQTRQCGQFAVPFLGAWRGHEVCSMQCGLIHNLFS